MSENICKVLLIFKKSFVSNVLETTDILFFSHYYLSVSLSHHCVILIHEKCNKFKLRVLFLVENTIIFFERI